MSATAVITDSSSGLLEVFTDKGVLGKQTFEYCAREGRPRSSLPELQRMHVNSFWAVLTGEGKPVLTSSKRMRNSLAFRRSKMTAEDFVAVYRSVGTFELIPLVSRGKTSCLDPLVWSEISDGALALQEINSSSTNKTDTIIPCSKLMTGRVSNMPSSILQCCDLKNGTLDVRPTLTNQFVSTGRVLQALHSSVFTVPVLYRRHIPAHLRACFVPQKACKRATAAFVGSKKASIERAFPNASESVKLRVASTIESMKSAYAASTGVSASSAILEKLSFFIPSNEFEGCASVQMTSRFSKGGSHRVFTCPRMNALTGTRYEGLCLPCVMADVTISVASALATGVGSFDNDFPPSLFPFRVDIHCESEFDFGDCLFKRDFRGANQIVPFPQFRATSFVQVGTDDPTTWALQFVPPSRNAARQWKRR